MANALVKASNFAVYRETTYDTAPSLGTIEAHLIEMSGVPEFNDSFESIERDISRQSFSTYAPIRGLETTSGSFSVECHGSGSNDTALETHEVWRAAFGYSIGPSGETVTDETLSTTINATPAYTKSASTLYTDPQMYEHQFDVTSETDFQVGYPCRVTDSTGATLKLAGFIIDITDDAITVLSAEPDDVTLSGGSDILDCGYMYTLRAKDLSQVVNLPSLTFRYWRGDIVREEYTGNIITELSFDASTGQLINPSFSWEGASISYDTNSGATGKYVADGGGTTSFDSANTSPMVAQLTDIFMESNEDTPVANQACVSNIQFTISNTVYKKQCLGSRGIGEVIRTSRAVTGSFSTFYEDEAFQEAFRADTSYEFRAMFNYTTSLASGNVRAQTTEPGNIFAIYIPQFTISNISLGEEEGLFKYDNEFAASPVSGDDEIVVSFL